MVVPLQPALVQLQQIVTQGHNLRRAIATGHQRNAQPRWRRVELRPVQVRDGCALQIVSYDDQQAHTRQCAFGPEAEAAAHALLAEGYAHWHVETHDATWQVRVTKRGEALMHRARPATKRRWTWPTIAIKAACCQPPTRCGAPWVWPMTAVKFSRISKQVSAGRCVSASARPHHHPLVP